MDRSRKPCTRDGCTYPRHAKKLCAGHYLEEYPRAPGEAKPRKQAPAKPRTAMVRTQIVRKQGPAKPRTPLTTTRAASTAKPKRRTASVADGIPEEVRAVVLERSGDLCEACGRPLGYAPHLHHRRRRRESTHTADNLVALHSTCHVVAPEAVHQRPTWAKERGLIVPTWADPTITPLTLPSGRTVFLHPLEPLYLDQPDGPHQLAA